MGEARTFAPAKLNLFLHVGPVADDGYHPIASLMAFANVGDAIIMRPAPLMAFTLSGPFAAQLSNGPDNLAVQARDRLLARCALPPEPFALELHKALPIAAGLGGGSADGAAVLRLLGRQLGLERDLLAEIAATLGADAPACLESRPVMAAGRGDLLSPAPGLPGLDLVLVNPVVASPTAEVYGAYDRGPVRTADLPTAPASFATAAGLVEFLAACRNDLEPVAVALQPAIGAVLDALTGRPETLLARMSGSGATCFAICASAEAGAGLTEKLKDSGWWVRQARIGGALDV